MTLNTALPANVGVVDVLPFVLMIAAGLATGLGVVPVAFFRGLSPRGEGILLGFTSGVMLAVVFLDLVPDALRTAAGDMAPVFGSMALGVALIGGFSFLARRLPVPQGLRPADGRRGDMAFVLFLALAVHHAPEGLAIGMGYAEGATLSGHLVALAIALQNVPEGFLVALPVYLQSRSVRTAAGYTFLSGLVQPTAGILALLFLTLTPGLLAAAYGIAAGGMLGAVLSQTAPHALRRAKLVGFAESAGMGLLLVGVVHWSVAFLLV